VNVQNQWLIDLGAENADRHRNVRKAIRTNTLGVRLPIDVGVRLFLLQSVNRLLVAAFHFSGPVGPKNSADR
jgi:hypothetical protein